MMRLPTRFLLLIGLFAVMAATISGAYISEVKESNYLQSVPSLSLSTVDATRGDQASLVIGEKRNSNSSRHTEAALEVYEEQDSEKSSLRRNAVGQALILFSFALALILIHRKNKQQFYWLSDSPVNLPERYILLSVFRI